ncbi:MAG: 4,5-DOPA dioxygenase extradiol [Flavobacteriales bacterium]|nr:4,5-DOPA dioxygenase extradiol [Flavobacteriales bacterium]
MNRRNILKALALLPLSAAAMKLKELRLLTDLMPATQVMPVLFVGHGSPMNAIEDNDFNRQWRKIGASIPKPAAVLCVSAHWETKGTFVTAMEQPRTIHDFGGFPKALFDVDYKAPGSIWLANETQQLVKSASLGMDESWSLDHGAWSVMKHLYPEADVPVIQMSLDVKGDTRYHYNLARELAALRRKGVLIVGSGNMVHNFSYMQMPSGGFNVPFGHDWALEANETFKKLIHENDAEALINFKQYSTALKLSAPTPDHYLPMIYALALREKTDNLSFFNDAVVGGSFSMTSFVLSS